MATLALGIAILVVALWAMNLFTKADAQKLGRLVRHSGAKLGGIAVLGFAGFLGIRGQWGLAVPIGIAGLSMLGWLPFGPAGFGARTQKRTGQVSRVRSAYVEMELDHDTGAMRGRILTGRHEGVTLDALDVPTLVAALAEIDEESRALMMAYLDRREPGWRAHAEGGAHTREAASPQSGKMTEEEAYQILGLQPGAAAEEIGRAHRALMKKLHPDQGGSTYLAARVNEAKEVLLRRHR